ncbi:MAG: DNA repair protein RecN [Verrucomicrobia bacterium]|nr:DNA repair protein RecN [Verrucomicrobiota bacterium]
MYYLKFLKRILKLQSKSEMLLRLFIKNLVLVETCEILFQPGFTVITGETGAGKSIILSSLSLLLGQRQDSSLIRQGASSSSIEATFNIPKVLPLLDEAGITYDDSQEVTIRRELLASGKSRAFVNDQVVQLSLLKKLAPFLIEVSGQHAHIELTQHGKPMDILDCYADSPIEPFQESYRNLLALKKLKSDFRLEKQALIRKIETAEREIEEIEKINPQEGEDDELFKEYSELATISQSVEQLVEIVLILDGTSLSDIGRAKNLLERLGQKNESFQATAATFKEAYSQLQQITFELNRTIESNEDSQERFTQLDERLKALHQLKKKYGPTLQDVIDWKEKQKDALKTMLGQDVSEEELDEKLAHCEAITSKHAKALSDARQLASARFSAAITDELHQLNMPSALFEVGFMPQERSSSGDEAVQFWLTPNRGESKVLIQEAASGGEIARLWLAIKCVMMGKNPVGTILFDEVDANIGGQTATVVGRKLKELGKSCQVLAVSHFAQVASHADAHLCIQKVEHDMRTTTHIRHLDSQEKREEELNRMKGLSPVAELVV